MKPFCCWAFPILLAGSLQITAQTNLATITPDGAWTWFNDPRAMFHNGLLYVGSVRRADGRATLTGFNLQTGISTNLWSSTWSERDDHDNPGLLRLLDGRLLAIYARHGSASSFNYRTSLNTIPITSADWSAEQTFTNTTAGITYANPYQLSSEPNRTYDFMRNLNFNPTFTLSTNSATNWLAAQLLIKTGTGSTRPYVKYGSDYSNRIDFLYTDGHPDEVPSNSLYHAYYRNAALYKTDGTFLKYLTNAPLLHDAGERGSVIYQYSTAPTNDFNAHIPTARAWCAELTYQANGEPACVFWVQVTNVAGSNWFDDRIYYYYARWTGSNWQKRFIAQGGRPLYDTQRYYAGGIALDSEDPSAVYLSSDAANPFDLTSLTNVPLRAHFEIYKGITTDGGLSFAWSAVTTNSAVDNLRPYVPRNRQGVPALLWFRGTYTSYTSFNTEIVGLFTNRVPSPPRVSFVSPANPLTLLPNPADRLKLAAAVTDDGTSGPIGILWTTLVGPTNALFADVTNLITSVAFPQPGFYTLRLTVSNALLTTSADLAVQAGASGTLTDASLAMWLKLDETTGTTVHDSAWTNNGALAGGVWRPGGGILGGALAFDGASTVATIPDSPSLDNTPAFTLAFWFRADAFTVDSGGLVSKRDGVSSNNAFTTYLKRPDQHIYVDIDGSNNRFASAAIINTGVWHHVVLVFNGSLAQTERASLWLDGSLDTTAAESSTVLPAYPSSLRLGNTHGGAANWFNGLIDDVRFYRRALTPSEIGLLAATNSAPNVACGPQPMATSGVPAALNGTANDDGIGGPLTALWSLVNGPGNARFADSNSPITTATFSQAGPYKLRLSASDTKAEVFDEVDVTVTPNTNVYADWIALAFPGQTNSAIIGFTADPDADRAANLLEFALGMNPNVSDAQPFARGRPGLPVGAIQNFNGANYLVLRVQRPIGRLGIGYSAEVSPDLLVWYPLAQLPPADNGDGTELVTFPDFLPAAQASSRFIRLKIGAN